MHNRLYGLLRRPELGRLHDICFDLPDSLGHTSEQGDRISSHTPCRFRFEETQSNPVAHQRKAAFLPIRETSSCYINPRVGNAVSQLKVIVGSYHYVASLIFWS